MRRGPVSVADDATGSESVAGDAARAGERGGFKGGCCAPSAAKTKRNAASGRISTRFSRHCRTNLHAKYLRRDSSCKRVLKMTSCVHRFLISGGRFGNRCSFLPRNALQRAVILDLKG